MPLSENDSATPGDLFFVAARRCVRALTVSHPDPIERPEKIVWASLENGGGEYHRCPDGVWGRLELIRPGPPKVAPPDPLIVGEEPIWSPVWEPIHFH
jgi:hypothetical protein